jgi:hypothetical protein
MSRHGVHDHHTHLKWVHGAVTARLFGFIGIIAPMARFVNAYRRLQNKEATCFTNLSGIFRGIDLCARNMNLDDGGVSGELSARVSVAFIGEVSRGSYPPGCSISGLWWACRESMLSLHAGGKDISEVVSGMNRQ